MKPWIVRFVPLLTSTLSWLKEIKKWSCGIRDQLRSLSRNSNLTTITIMHKILVLYITCLCRSILKGNMFRSLHWRINTKLFTLNYLCIQSQQQMFKIKHFVGKWSTAIILASSSRWIVQYECDSFRQQWEAKRCYQRKTLFSFRWNMMRFYCCDKVGYTHQHEYISGETLEFCSMFNCWNRLRNMQGNNDCKLILFWFLTLKLEIFSKKCGPNLPDCVCHSKVPKWCPKEVISTC